MIYYGVLSIKSKHLMYFSSMPNIHIPMTCHDKTIHGKTVNFQNFRESILPKDISC